MASSATGQTVRIARVAASDPTSSAYLITGIKRHKWTAALALAALAVAVAAATYFYSLRSGGATIDSIAVMPFINVSGDPNTEYLSEGISESVNYSLSHLPNLKVMASTTVFRYKGRQIDARIVGRELGVSAVLTGKVVQRGDVLTVSAELVDARDNRLLWGGQYNRKVSDFFAIQEEISRQISDTLRLQISAEDQKRLSKRQTESTEAYQAYLKARYYWNKRTQEAVKKGIEHFQEAIDLDPNYALAYAGIADSYIILGVYSSLPPAEAFTKAKAMALKALEIDDALAEAHTSLAYVRFRHEWNWSGAEAEYRRAIELNPNYATAYQWAALNRAAVGRLDEAIAEMKRAEAIDPLSLIINSNMEWVLYLARRNDDAIAHCRETLQIDSSFFATHKYLGLMYVQKGMYDEAITEYQKARDLSADDPHLIALIGHAHALSERRDKAKEALADLKALSNRRYVSPYSIALIYAGLGEREREPAFAWLEKAYEDRSSLMIYLKVEPMLDSLRSDPRFADLLHRIGLPT